MIKFYNKICVKIVKNFLKEYFKNCVKEIMFLYVLINEIKVFISKKR